MYFVPHIKDYCSDTAPVPCAKFWREVKMQGSGTLQDNKILTYRSKRKPQDIGDCNTAIGASGQCLIPYISVAADPEFYRMGDIIRVPALTGKWITLPDGSRIQHPGFFIVQDVGGAIKGKNRFDFFTGSRGLNDPDNAFGAYNSLGIGIADKDLCPKEKQFMVVRRSSPDFRKYLVTIKQVMTRFMPQYFQSSSFSSSSHSSVVTAGGVR
jgi:membrane-bound lytic murein transglycosylase A